METLGLIIKPTRKCNLRCSYCQDWRSKSNKMSFDVLTKLTAEALSPVNNRIDFIWHGGEPLTLGVNFFTKAIALQEKFQQPHQRIKNSIQTNGTLITKEWCEFFVAYGMEVGVSIDGPKEIHDSNRNYSNGKTSFNDVKRGIDLLKKYEIPFGMLMVLNESTLSLSPTNVYDFFKKELKVNNFSFLAARPDNTADGTLAIESQYTDTGKYISFMKKMFDVWYEDDDPKIKIRELNSILGAVIGKLPTVCTLAGNCIGQYFLVEMNGDLYHCDKYLGDKDYHVGNILNNSFAEIKTSDSLINLAKNENLEIMNMQSCEFFGICNGGCPHDRYTMKKYLPSYNSECCGQNELIGYINERVSKEVNVDNCLTDHLN